MADALGEPIPPEVVVATANPVEAVAETADSAQQHAEASKKALAKGDITTATKEATVAATESKKAEEQLKAGVQTVEPEVKRELRREKPFERLPTSSMAKIAIFDNGWNLYNSILIAKDNLNRVVQIDKELPDYNKKALELSKQIKFDTLDPIITELMTTYQIPDNATNDMLREKLKEVEARTDIGDAKDDIKNSLRFQYQTNSAVYKETRGDKKTIESLEQYKTLIGEPIDPNDLDKGPKAYPDIPLFLPQISKILDVSVYIYRPSKSEPTVYKLVTSARIDGKPEIFILHTNRNHLSILSPKIKTDSTAHIISTVKDAIQSAKNKTTAQLATELETDDNIILTADIKDTIKVAGERVSLQDDFDESKTSGGKVSFYRYFPDEDDREQIDVLKKVFNTFFSELEFLRHSRTDKTVEIEAFPPCEELQREIIERGIANRLTTLKDEINDIRSSDHDTLKLRTLIVKFNKLFSFNNTFNNYIENGNCMDYGKGNVPGKFSKISSQQEEDIRSLLRQFAFMILQSKNPIGEYSDRTDEAKDIVEQLRQKPITSTNMQTYLELWREKAKKDKVFMPNTLIEILDKTNTQASLIEKMADDQIEALVKEFIDTGRTGLQHSSDVAGQTQAGGGDTQLQEFELLVQKLTEEHQMPRDKANAIMKWVVNNMQTQWEMYQKAKEEEDKIAGQLDAKSNRIESLSKQLEDTATKILDLEKELQAKIKENTELAGSGTEAHATMEKLKSAMNLEKDSLTFQVTDLQAQLDSNKKELDIKKAELLTLKTSSSSSEAKAVDSAALASSLQTQVNGLQQQLTQATNQLGTLTTERDSLTAQLAAKTATIAQLEAKEGAATAAAAAATAKVAGLEAKVATLTQSLEGTAKSELAAATAKIAETQGLLDAAKAEQAALEKEKSGIAAELATSNAAQTTMQKSIDALYLQMKQKSDELMTTKEAAIQTQKQAENATNDIKAKLTISEASIQEKLRIIAANADSIAGLQGNIKDLEAKLQAYSSSVAQLEKAVVEDKQKYAALDASSKIAADKALAGLQKLNAEKNIIQEELDKQKTAYEAQIASLKATMKEQELTIQQLKSELAIKTSDLIAATTEKEKATAALSALQRTYNADIKQLGDSLRAKQLESQGNVEKLQVEIKQAKALLIDAQKMVSTLSGQVEAQKNLADQVPELQKKLGEQTEIAQTVPDLTKELDSLHAKLDNLPKDSALTAANVAQIEKELSTASKANIKLKYSPLFNGIIQKKGDSLGTWNNRDAAMCGAASRVWYIQFENTTDYPKRMVISISEPPIATQNPGEFTMKTMIKGKETVYTFKEVAGGPTRDQWIAKYTELAKQTTATTKQGATNDLTTVLSELQHLASSIVDGKQYTVPNGLAAQAGPVFMQIFDSVQKMKTSAPPSSSNQACFLSYFIVFFFKVLFFTKTDTQRRQNILKKINTITDNILSAIKKAKIFPDGTEDKNIIFKVLNVIFTLIDASETLFINKETRAGLAASATDIGLSVIKTKEDSVAKRVLEVIYSTVKDIMDATFNDDMNFIEKKLLADMVIQQPKIVFNKPLNIKAPADATQDAKDLVSFPNMTFMPNGIPDIQQKDINGRFQIIDVPGGFKRRQRMVNDIIPSAAPEWKNAISVAMQDTTLQYPTLFTIFVVFGRKYLVAAKEDLKNTCKIPALLEDPGTILTSMSAEPPAKTTPVKDPSITELPPDTTPTCDISIKKLYATTKLGTTVISALLSDNARGIIKGEKYTWAYTSNKDKTKVIPISDTDSIATVSFPSAGTYTVTCDLTYNKGGNDGCKATQASISIEILSGDITPTVAPPVSEVQGPVATIHDVQAATTNAIKAAKTAANAIAARKAANGSSIKNNALSMSPENFKASLLKRGLPPVKQ